MPFIPHTPDDVKEMLAVIEAKDINDLFDEIPAGIPKAPLEFFDRGLKESEISRLMQDRTPSIKVGGCFIGAGAYEHYIPAIINDIISRGEFYSAYTPYQAEASQGTLQALFEYQTMICQLTGMEVSNASVYDGANALAEAILMAIRIRRSAAKKVIMPITVSPFYRKVVETVLTPQKIEIIYLPYTDSQGTIDFKVLTSQSLDEVAALVIPQPNFLGILEDVDQLVNFAHQAGLLAIALVNPLALSILKEPGSWGNNGADIVCGEGQSLGLPLSYGGPYFGFVCCKKDYLRQLPGRIVGKTHDAQNRVGYTLTLQTREQHIRRAKATSNICTNQGLFVTAATIYLTLMGAAGLKKIASASHANAVKLKQRLIAIDGVSSAFEQPFFHEFVIRLKQPVHEVLEYFTNHGVQAGYSLKKDYPELGECLMVCATETKTDDDIERYAQLLRSVMETKASSKPSVTNLYI